MPCQRIRFSVALFLVPMLAPPATAATPRATGADPIGRLDYDRGMAGLELALRRLSTRCTLLAIVAHPDDEDGPLLTYAARGLGCRVTLLSLTRGEGGEDRAGLATGAALGTVRQAELARAVSYYGISLRWGALPDFGFSRSLAEAEAIWGHEAISEVAQAIRETRPLAIVSPFIGGPSDGHGQHQFAGAAFQQGFVEASQGSGNMAGWRVPRAYVQIPFARQVPGGMLNYATGETVPLRFLNRVTGTIIEGMPSEDVSVPVGTFDPVIGRSWLEIAREGLRQQRSQLSPAPQLPGNATSGYYRIDAPWIGATGGADLFAGIDTRLQGLAMLVEPTQRSGIERRLAHIAALVARARAGLDPRHPDGVAPLLAEGLSRTRSLLKDLGALAGMPASEAALRDALTAKEQQFQEALALALGVEAAAIRGAANPATAAMPLPVRPPLASLSRFLTAGEQLQVTVIATSQAPEALPATAELEGCGRADWSIRADSNAPPALEANRRALFGFVAITPRLSGTDAGECVLRARLRFRYAGQSVALEIPVHGSDAGSPQPFDLDPVKLVPAWSVEAVEVAHGGTRSFDVAITIRNRSGARSGTVRIELPTGFAAFPAQLPFRFEQANEVRILRFRIDAADGTDKGKHGFRVRAIDASGNAAPGYRLIRYPDLPALGFAFPAAGRIEVD